MKAPKSRQHNEKDNGKRRDESKKRRRDMHIEELRRCMPSSFG
jgi:hypothetical protein